MTVTGWLPAIQRVSAFLTLAVAALSFGLESWGFGFGVLVGGGLATLNMALLLRLLSGLIGGGAKRSIAIGAVSGHFFVLLGVSSLALYWAEIDPVGFLVGFHCWPAAALFQALFCLIKGKAFSNPT